VVKGFNAAGHFHNLSSGEVHVVDVHSHFYHLNFPTLLLKERVVDESANAICSWSELGEVVNDIDRGQPKRLDSLFH
jgi:hypothetical protein